MNAKPSFDAKGLTLVMSGAAADVWMNRDCYNAYLELRSSNDLQSIRKLTQIDRVIERYCEKGGAGLPQEQWRSEGRFKCGASNGARELVWAMKAHQWRLYGGVKTYNNRICFIGTNVDPSKKQQKANQNELQKAATAFFRLGL